jgi:hypothetical protein
MGGAAGPVRSTPGVAKAGRKRWHGRLVRLIDGGATAPRWREPVGGRPGPEQSLERVTTIAMSTESDGIVESEDLAAGRDDSPTVVALLD